MIELVPLQIQFPLTKLYHLPAFLLAYALFSIMRVFYGQFLLLLLLYGGCVYGVFGLVAFKEVLNDMFCIIAIIEAISLLLDL